MIQEINCDDFGGRPAEGEVFVCLVEVPEESSLYETETPAWTASLIVLCLISLVILLAYIGRKERTNE